MTEEDYKKLNCYLNTAFPLLEYEDQFLINNVSNIDVSISDLQYYLKDLEIDSDIKENNLTFQDVFLIARDIIASINPIYLKEYDNLIDSGQLDFSYNYDYSDSECVYFSNSKMRIININRDFNYYDVVMLIHEFIHYTNMQTENNINEYLLTEFISIYFEIYAQKYLIDKGVPTNEISLYRRLQSTFNHSQQFQKYSPVLFAFSTFGNFAEDSIDFINKHFYPMSSDEFNKSCKYVLDKFKQIENKYRMDIKYEKNFDNTEFAYKLSEPFKYNYRYILGAMLAFYAIEYCDINDILYLNDNINKDECMNMDPILLLKKIKIDINDEFFTEKVAYAIRKFVDKNKQR